VVEPGVGLLAQECTAPFLTACGAKRLSPQTTWVWCIPRGPIIIQDQAWIWLSGINLHHVHLVSSGVLLSSPHGSHHSYAH
jgi:hypothetical protein